MKALLLVLPIITVISVGGATLATRNASKSDPPTPPVSKVSPFDHDKEIDVYLSSVKGFLLEMPNDKRFGFSRVVPVAKHVSPALEVRGYREVQNLTKDHVIRTFVLGTKKPNEVNNPTWQSAHLLDPKKLKALAAGMKLKQVKEDLIRRNELLAEDIKRVNPPKLVSSTIRMREVLSDQYKRISADRFYVREPQKSFEPEIVDAVLKLKPMLDAKGYDTYSEPITVKGIKGNLMAKAVRPPTKACLSCHTDVKTGQPIGYAMAIIWKKK